MTPSDANPQAALRRQIYLLLIVVSTAAMVGRILALDSVDVQGLQKFRLETVDKELREKEKRDKARGLSGAELQDGLAKAKVDLLNRAKLQRPFLSANDRSRWCTLRALIEPDMRVPDAPFAIDKVIQQPGWDTIDMVKHDEHLYSSKPTLLTAVYAPFYWLIYNTTGASLGTHPYEICRFLLILFNVVPLAGSFLVLARLVERFGQSDWGRIFAMAAAVFGTFLTTFAVTMNNHNIAAVCAVIALDTVVRIWFDGERKFRWFVVAGLAGAFMAANELPSLAMFAGLSLVLLWRAPGKTLLVYAPAAAVIAAASLGTNWIAHHSFKPPYAHRRTADPTDDWYTYTYERNKKVIHSYWENPAGLDAGEKSRATYAQHVLVGHHGLFSLTPIWLLTVAGLGVWLVRPPDGRLRWLSLLIGSVSLVCLVFYLTRYYEDCNYGGMSSGLRWMFWFAPLWIVAMLPALDAMAGRRWLRGLALVMLLVSVLSVSYPTWNPWTHPWLLNYLQYLGYIKV